MHTQKYFDHQTISDDERRLNYVKRVSFNTLELFAGHYCDHQTRPCIAVARLMTHIGQGCSKPDKITYGPITYGQRIPTSVWPTTFDLYMYINVHISAATGIYITDRNTGNITCYCHANIIVVVVAAVCSIGNIYTENTKPLYIRNMCPI